MLKILLFLLPLVVSAQDRSLLDRFYAGLAESHVQMTYSYTARISGINNHGTGTLSVQGPMWKASGNGVEMYCDSSSVWVIDPAMKEVVIEPSADEASVEYVTNPAAMLVRLYDLFKVVQSRISSDGFSEIYTLHTLSETGIDYVNMEISKQDILLKRASFALSDGTLVKIEVSSMKLTPKVSNEAFRPQNMFGDDWIVTDLR